VAVLRKGDYPYLGVLGRVPVSTPLGKIGTTGVVNYDTGYF